MAFICVYSKCFFLFLMFSFAFLRREAYHEFGGKFYIISDENGSRPLTDVKNKSPIVKFRPIFLSSSEPHLESVAVQSQEFCGVSHEVKVKQFYKFNHFLRFFGNKSMCFIAQKHAFLSIKALLLSDKSIEFTFRNHDRFCNILKTNKLQNHSFSHYFRQKNFWWKILQGEC